MKAKDELEKLQAMRAKFEEESRLLAEEQQTLEKNVLALEEQVVSQELKKEKALVEDLRNKNKTVKNTIAQLEAKKEELETKLSQITQTSEPAPEAHKSSASPKQPEKAEEVVEAQEKPQKKKKRFF